MDAFGAPRAVALYLLQLTAGVLWSGRKWLVTLAPLGGTVLTLGMALRPSLPMYLLHSALSNPFAVTQLRAQSVMVSDIVPRSTMEFWFISRHPSINATPLVMSRVGAW